MSTAPRIAAVVSGLAYVALGITSLTGPVPDHDWGTRGALVNLFGIVAFAANVLAVERLRSAYRLGTVGGAAVRVTQVGLTAMVVESVVSQINGGNTLSAVFFLGLLATLLGLLVLAVVGVRQAGSRWVAPLPFLGMLLGIGAGEHGGFLLTGVVWLVLAIAAIGRPAVVGQPVAAGVTGD